MSGLIRHMLGTALLLAAFAQFGCKKAEAPKPAQKLPEILVSKSGVEMIRIPGGWFEMGSTEGESDEAPVHRVWIDSFFLDRYEVTQEQYGKLVLGNPSHFKGPKNPVEQISWADAALYCNARSKQEGLDPCYDEETAKCDFGASGYRLPTEAEWEYACRAGARGKYCFGNDTSFMKQYAWFADNALKKTHPVGGRKPNPWRLFDMHGNVAEWCNDVYGKTYYAGSAERNPRGPADGDKYVLRGGAWNSSADACRSARRVGEDPGFQDACFARDAIGFRCARNDSSKQEQPRSDGNGDGKETGFLYDDFYLKHDTRRGHPERPSRLAAIHQRLDDTGLLKQLVRFKAQPADEKWILTIHSEEYLLRVKSICKREHAFIDTMDVPVSAESCDVALAAAGGVLSVIDAVVDGRIRNGFCAIRPPGHHARKDEAMGFCIFNNIAIAARYIQQKHGLKRILIVDWDVHHGNGTQEAFYDDPTVFYFGVHQYPHYPYTGAAHERGSGDGLGCTLNVPLPAGCGDDVFAKVFTEKLKPAAEKFKPDFVLISAGFDTHKDDPLGGMEVTAEGFGELTRIVKGIAEKHCNGRIVSLLEGGYNLEALAASVEAHVRGLME